MKRLFDFVVAIVLGLVLWPVMIGIAGLIRWRLGTPILFRQVRIGKDARPFILYKFRTMREAHDAAGELLPDAERLTRLGRFLRATSLDELPELWNVIKGDMSLVGPRPLLPEYLPLYSPRQMRRHEVRPGLTGWAQIHGRNATTWQERLEYDVWYVEHRSFLLDMWILLRTIGVVLSRHGVSSPGHVSMPPFTGNQDV